MILVNRTFYDWLAKGTTDIVYDVPDYSKKVFHCACCGKTFKPVFHRGKPFYSETLSIKNLKTCNAEGSLFNFTNTKAFKNNKKLKIKIACCSFSCLQKIRSQNKENISLT